MSSDIAVTLGGTQNKAWAESLNRGANVISRCEKVLRNENDENDGMERGRRSREGRRWTANTHSDETKAGELG